MADRYKEALLERVSKLLNAPAKAIVGHAFTLYKFQTGRLLMTLREYRMGDLVEWEALTFTTTGSPVTRISQERGTDGLKAVITALLQWSSTQQRAQTANGAAFLRAAASGDTDGQVKIMSAIMSSSEIKDIIEAAKSLHAEGKLAPEIDVDALEPDIDYELLF